MDDNTCIGARPTDQALVSDQAAARFAPSGFDPSRVDYRAVRYDPNYPCFGLLGEPRSHKQHPNQRKGLDLYVDVINFETGEWCFKKLYKNTRGLHFKHTGYSPMYLADFTDTANFVPFQVLFPTSDSDGSPKGGDGEAGSVHDSADPKGIAHTQPESH